MRRRAPPLAPARGATPPGGGALAAPRRPLRWEAGAPLPPLPSGLPRGALAPPLIRARSKGSWSAGPRSPRPRAYSWALPAGHVGRPADRPLPPAPDPRRRLALPGVAPLRERVAGTGAEDWAVVTASTLELRRPLQAVGLCHFLVRVSVRDAAGPIRLFALEALSPSKGE